jgi:c-di-GMP-related signal transduction protein
MKNTDILFCRKAVVNRLSETTAYYILHPSSTIKGRNASFLSSLFVDVNLTEITQQKTIFFQSDLDELSALPLQTNIHMVIFLDAGTLTEAHFEMLSERRLQGYQLGVINPKPDTTSVDLLNVFSYVMFSLDHLSIEDATSRIKHPFILSKNIWIDAIHSAEQFSSLQNLASDGLFSGDFIHKVTLVKGKRILAHKAILIDLLAALNDHESSPRVLAEYIERDPTLTYRIIKLTHSVLYRSQFNVSNAQRAIEIIGIRDLIKWVSLAMLSSVSGKPDCLFSMAVSRACFCQSLSSSLFPKLEGAFLVGLFSYLPSFLDEELPQLLKDLPLEGNIKSALLEYKGNLGGILKIVEAYEAGRWEKIPFDRLANKDISMQSLKDLYVESLNTARKMGAL